MNSDERRTQILQILQSSNGIINASRLAEKFDVTRQVIVSDIALLRAKGYQIFSEKRGYFIQSDNNGMMRKDIRCRHKANEVLDEFYAIVDNGGRVLNVMVEHPMYGKISVDIDISSRYDAQEFVEKSAQCKASQLCNLTDGLHTHTVCVPNQEAYNRIVARLSELGILAN